MGSFNHGTVHKNPCNADKNRRQVPFRSKTSGPGISMAKHVARHCSIPPGDKRSHNQSLYFLTSGSFNVLSKKFTINITSGKVNGHQ